MNDNQVTKVEFTKKIKDEIKKQKMDVVFYEGLYKMSKEFKGTSLYKNMNALQKIILESTMDKQKQVLDMTKTLLTINEKTIERLEKLEDE